jgi:hypothetical protein
MKIVRGRWHAKFTTRMRIILLSGDILHAAKKVLLVAKFISFHFLFVLSFFPSF